jgi:signal transduction histidine kinase
MTQTGKGYQVLPFSKMRRFALDAGRLSRRRHIIHGLLEVDVTDARLFIRDHEARTGETLSFTAFIITCLGRAVDRNKQLHAYLNWRKQLVIFDDVNVNTMIEVDMDGRKVPMPRILKAVNKRTFRDIHSEIREVQARPGRSVESKSMRWLLLLPAWVRHAFYWIVMHFPQFFREYSSPVLVTAVGMFGQGAGWGIPAANFTLTVTLGGIAEKAAVVDGQVQIREHLSMTLSFDHDIIDGAPAARFTQHLKDLIESGYGLVAPEAEIDGGQRGRPETGATTEEPGDLGQGSSQAAESPPVEGALPQLIIDGVTEPIMVIGTDYRVRLMNRAAREFSSADAKVPQPTLCYQVSHWRTEPCDGTEHPCPLEQVRQSGQPVTVVHQHYQADGEPRHVEVIASPLWGADGSFEGIIESVRDITQRKRDEEALQQYAERLRALAARLAEVAEVERQRLARELHDQVGQNLTALGINLNIMRAGLPDRAEGQMSSRLDDSLSLVERTAERIRDLMAELRPSVLDDYGLLSALHWYGEQFAARTNIATTVEGEEPPRRLPAHVESALFRIAQEALTNVAKHAQASAVTIRVEEHKGRVRLTVTDDGTGFDAAERGESSGHMGYGLLTMSERAEAAGGQCRVRSYPGQGTQVIVDVAR